MWALAVRELRIASDEFWRLTPRQFQVLLKRHEAAYERFWEPFAGVMAVLAEINRDTKKRAKPYGPEDFRLKRPEPVKVEQAVAGQIEMIAALTVGLGGKDLRKKR